MILRTHRLVLRPYASSDWDDFRQLVQDHDLMQRLSGALTSEQASRLFVKLCASGGAPEMIGWAVTLEGRRAFCGHVFLHKVDLSARSSEIGFVLARPFQRRGFATELAIAVLGYARDELGYRSVSASVDEDHEASKRALSRAGLSLASREHDEQGSYLVYRVTF